MFPLTTLKIDLLKECTFNIFPDHIFDKVVPRTLFLNYVSGAYKLRVVIAPKNPI